MMVETGKRWNVEYNVYTKPLFMDKMETRYRVDEAETMKYTQDDAMKAAERGGAKSELDAEEENYRKRASAYSGTVEVGASEGCDVVYGWRRELGKTA